MPLANPAASSRRNPAELLGSVAIVLVLVLALFGPNMSMGFRAEDAASGEGSPIRQALYLLTFLIAVASARPWQKPARVLAVPLSIMLALVWCWLSLAWAIEPSAALRRLLLTTILIWTIFLATKGAGYERTLSLFRMVMLVLLVGNLAAVVFLPHIGIHDKPDPADPALVGAWRGLLLQKNFAGAAAAVTILLFTFDTRPMHRLVSLGVIAGSSVFLLGTLSKTSLGIGIAALAVGWLFRRYNPGYRTFLIPALLLVGAAVVYALASEWAALISGLNHDRQAFTGRVELWIPLLAYARDHILTGAGYGSFWNIGQAREPIHDYATGWVTVQTSGHNGFLDMLVQVGLPGLVLIVIACFAIPLGRLMTSMSIPRQRGALLFALIFFCAGHNFTESSLLERDIAVNVFMLFAIALVPLSNAAPARRRAAEHPRHV